MPSLSSWLVVTIRIPFLYSAITRSNFYWIGDIFSFFFATKIKKYQEHQ